MFDVRHLIHEAAEQATKETDHEPEPSLTAHLDWPVRCDVGPGLEGAMVCETRIGYVNGTKGWLVYRGYNCFDLAEMSSFEETTYLLLFGKLPSRKELIDFNRKLVSYRAIPDQVVATLREMPIDTARPMALLELGTSILGILDLRAENVVLEDETETAIKLIAQMPTLVGAVARLRQGLEPIAPNPDLGHAANLLYMMTGERPSPEAERTMDVCLILHADHGMNASTFTAMAVNSSLSDMYSSIVGGIASLKGPLHGGANERVLYDLQEIASVENVEPWFEQARRTKRKVMGFGHRVYKAYDPRARVLKPLADALTEAKPEHRRLFEIAVKLEDMVCATLGKEKKIFPNVDYYSGIVYSAMGIETPMFTPIFAVSRVSGWTARVLEYLAHNRIFRPRAIYTGPVAADYTPIWQR